MKAEYHLTVNVKVEGLDSVEEKLNRLNELLKEAKSLAHEIASSNCNLVVKRNTIDTDELNCHLGESIHDRLVELIHK